MPPTPFEISIPQADLDDLQERLARTRWPIDPGNDDWRYGANRAYLEELASYWRDGYDWRAQEAAINAFDHFRVTIDDVPIHFIHERGRGPNPTPIILTHGWPWTFWDFHDVIRRLSDPAAYGGDPADSFDVVVPSLPGFGFSTPLTKTGVHPGTTADLWHTLMTDVLGYERFAAQGGDWGAFVTANLGHRHAPSLIGVHLSMPALVGVGLLDVDPADYGPGEEEWPERMKRRMATTRSHLAVNQYDPQTHAYGLHDSPVGLAAWLVSRRRHWSACDGDVESVFSRDFLLTTVMLYWLTESFVTSVRYYWENRHAGWSPRVHERSPAIEAPTGVAVFPQELLLYPRKLVARHANLVHWSVMERGGHFAAAEQPEALARDVAEMFRALR